MSKTIVKRLECSVCHKPIKNGTAMDVLMLSKEIIVNGVVKILKIDPVYRICGECLKNGKKIERYGEYTN